MTTRIAARSRVQSALEEKVKAIRDLEADKASAGRSVAKLQKALADAESDIRGLTMENTRLANENKELRERVAELIRVAETISARRDAETRIHNDTIKTSHRSRKLPL